MKRKVSWVAAMLALSGCTDTAPRADPEATASASTSPSAQVGALRDPRLDRERLSVLFPRFKLETVERGPEDSSEPQTTIAILSRGRGSDRIRIGVSYQAWPSAQAAAAAFEKGGAAFGSDQDRQTYCVLEGARRCIRLLDNVLVEVSSLRNDTLSRSLLLDLLRKASRAAL